MDRTGLKMILYKEDKVILAAVIIATSDMEQQFVREVSHLLIEAVADGAPIPAPAPGRVDKVKGGWVVPITGDPKHMFYFTDTEVIPIPEPENKREPRYGRLIPSAAENKYYIGAPKGVIGYSVDVRGLWTVHHWKLIKEEA